MDKLVEEIKIESEYIEETLKLLNETMNRPEQSDIELSAIGSFLHHSYTGMENILKRIFKYLSLETPTSSSFHKDLLDLAVDQQIISNELSNKLDEYRGFRHFFVHAYGFMLEKEKLLPLVEHLPMVWQEFKNEINNTLLKIKTHI